MSNKTWKDLFGAAQNCACSDCSSIFSPSAYLVDVLQFLDACRTIAGGSVLDELFKRRPDINHLLLTCANTNTEIPYIDLVNEIMEFNILNRNGAMPSPPLRDTGNVTAQELRAEPQYTLADAYYLIYKNAVYPFDLPYHQPLDVIRTYLGFLNTSRAELMEVFNAGALPGLARDAEWLKLSLKEFGMLTSVDFNGTPTAAIPVELYYGNPAPAFTANGIPVADFIRRTGLSYVELIEILRTRFINPGQDSLNVLQNVILRSAMDAQMLYDKLAAIVAGGAIPVDLNALLVTKGVDPLTFPAWVITNFPKFSETITLYRSESGCDLENTILHSLKWIYETPGAAIDVTLSAGWLEKFHQFIRLWRKTGWNIQDLDAVIFALGKAVTDQFVIHALACIRRIQLLVDIPLLKLASLWGDIDYYGEYSLYAQLFLRRSGNLDSTNFGPPTPFVLSPLNQLAPGANKLIDNIPAICAALSISAEDYSTILNDAGINPATAVISGPSLSGIYRYKVLADGLEISVQDLCLLKSRCFGVDPFADVDQGLDFIQKVRKFQRSGFSAALLNYILNGDAKETDPFVVSKAVMLQEIPRLWQNLLTIDEEGKHQVPPLTPNVIEQLKQARIIAAIASLTGLDILTTRSITSKGIPPIIAAMMKQGLSGSYFKDNNFSVPHVDQTDSSINFLPGAIPLGALSIRWDGWISPPSDGEYTFTVTVLNNTQSAKLLIGGNTVLELNTGGLAATGKTVSGKTKLTGGKMAVISIEYVGAVNPEINLTWQSLTMPPVDLGGPFLYPRAAIENTVLDFMNQCCRAAQMIEKFSLTSEEVDFLTTHNSDFASIDFLKVKQDKWLRISDYVSVREKIPSEVLLGIFQNATSEFNANNAALPSDALLTKIAGAIGCNKDYLVYLAGNENTPVPTPSFYNFNAGSFRNEIALLTIISALDLAARTNMAISSTGLPAWVALESNWALPADFKNLYATAEQIKNAVKSKYKDNWLTIARQLNDSIRENQERALTSYLLTLGLKLNGEFLTDADSLFEYLLIDVQMTSIMVTSRVIQATLGAQLFADRCVLGLEEGISTDAVDVKQWDWMKHYSVAAGLKKLFIYVENYLDPSLRDDKSPFFKEFESHLKKSDITESNCEDGFREYLYKLNEVSNMDICGVYNHIFKDTLYVFARTHAAPYNYYFRTQNANKYWSPWENVPLDIKSADKGADSGVHLMPVVWKNRLFLFWPEFTPKTVKSGTASVAIETLAKSAPNDMAPLPYWEVRIAWSEYSKDKWTPKKISKEVIDTSIWAAIPDTYQILSSAVPDQYSFSPTVDSRNLLSINAGIKVGSLAVHSFGKFELTDVHEKILSSPKYDAAFGGVV